MPIWGPIGENKALDGEGENTQIYSISQCYVERAGSVYMNHKLWERVLVYLQAEPRLSNGLPVRISKNIPTPKTAY